MTKIIETARLILRPLKTGDLDDLLLLFQDPIAMQYFPSIRNREETLNWIQKIHDVYRQNGFSYWATIDKTDNRFIGYCGLHLQKNVDGTDEIEIGYGLLRKYWGQEFATEAAGACRDYGCNRLRFSRLTTLIRPKNTPSRQVTVRIGMIWEKDIMR